MHDVISRPAPRATCLARAGHIEVSVADRPQEVDEALRLRYRVFADEFGARLRGLNAPSDHDADAQVDRDVFDAHCRHLIAVDTGSGRVVGTYRVLLPEQARQLGFLYADREFHLSWLNPIRHDLVEMGRACIEPRYRNGVVLMMLWRAMRELVACHGHQYVIGCCSVTLRDGGVTAARLYRQLAGDHLAPPNQRVWPRNRLPIEALAGRHAAVGLAQEVEVPPLLRGYLRAGARILGEPHVDPQFGCADFPIMLEVSALAPRLTARLSQSA
jgi:putative hemolysin